MQIKQDIMIKYTILTCNILYNNCKYFCIIKVYIYFYIINLLIVIKFNL